MRVLAFEKAARVSANCPQTASPLTFLATPNDAGIRYEAIISSSSRDDKRITRARSAAGRVKPRKSWHSRWQRERARRWRVFRGTTRTSVVMPCTRDNAVSVSSVLSSSSCRVNRLVLRCRCAKNYVLSRRDRAPLLPLPAVNLPFLLSCRLYPPPELESRSFQPDVAL